MAKALGDIELICRSGGDFTALTPLLCRAIRRYIGAAAVAIFWMDAKGLPLGFHHEDSPVETRELFANEFERLFTGENEINVAFLSRMRGPNAGYLLEAPQSYYRSNTFNLLVRPSGHHYALDLRVDVGSRARIVVLAFREKGQPFCEGDALKLRRLEPLLAGALEAQPLDRWTPQGTDGHIIVDPDETTIRSLNAAGSALLAQSALVGQQVRLVGSPLTVPRFIGELCGNARRSGQPVTSATVIPAGRLMISAQSLHSPADDGCEGFVVTLRKQVPMSLAALDTVMDMRLSPTQKQLVIAAARGRQRGEAAADLALSPEALKKHLATVYSVLELHGWDDIAHRIQTPLG